MDQEKSANEELDRSLLRRIAQRDGAAIAELERRYASRLSVFIRHWISDPHLVEEVIQDVFLGVWTDAAHFKGESRVSTWLLGIARHKALSAARKRWPEPVDPQPPHPPSATKVRQADTGSGVGFDKWAPLPPSSEPERKVEAMEAAATLRKALGQLSPAHRATLELVFFHEMRLGEVAEVMRCPEGTVKSRLSYAKRQLRHILQSGRSLNTYRNESDRRRQL